MSINNTSMTDIYIYLYSLYVIDQPGLKVLVMSRFLSSIVIKLLAIALRTIAIAIAIVAKKAIEYCNMQ